MDADPLETAILQLRAAGRHGDAGSFEQLSQSVRADHSLDEGFKALLLGHLRVLAGFRAAQLEALPRGDHWSRRRAGRKTGRRPRGWTRRS